MSEYAARSFFCPLAPAGCAGVSSSDVHDDTAAARPIRPAMPRTPRRESRPTALSISRWVSGSRAARVGSVVSATSGLPVVLPMSGLRLYNRLQ
jgi:hypothetical protein